MTWASWGGQGWGSGWASIWNHLASGASAKPWGPCCLAIPRAVSLGRQATKVRVREHGPEVFTGVGSHVRGPKKADVWLQGPGVKPVDSSFLRAPYRQRWELVVPVVGTASPGRRVGSAGWAWGPHPKDQGGWKALGAGSGSCARIPWGSWRAAPGSEIGNSCCLSLYTVRTPG